MFQPTIIIKKSPSPFQYWVMEQYLTIHDLVILTQVCRIIRPLAQIALKKRINAIKQFLELVRLMVENNLQQHFDQFYYSPELLKQLAQVYNNMRCTGFSNITETMQLLRVVTVNNKDQYLAELKYPPELVELMKCVCNSMKNVEFSRYICKQHRSYSIRDDMSFNEASVALIMNVLNIRNILDHMQKDKEFMKNSRIDYLQTYSDFVPEIYIEETDQEFETFMEKFYIRDISTMDPQNRARAYGIIKTHIGEYGVYNINLGMLKNADTSNEAKFKKLLNSIEQ